jgi:hypothetical protein
MTAQHTNDYLYYNNLLTVLCNVWAAQHKKETGSVFGCTYLFRVLVCSTNRISPLLFSIIHYPKANITTINIATEVTDVVTLVLSIEANVVKNIKYPPLIIFSIKK